MTRIGAGLWVVLCWSVAVPTLLAAQTFSGGVLIAQVQVARERAATDESLDGTTLGLYGAGRLGMFSLQAVYQEGGLSADTAGVDADLVEGELMVGIDPTPWFGLAIGPHLRSFIAAGRTERWVFFETRLRAHAVLVGPVRAFLEGWRVLGSDVNVAEGVGSAYGVDGGILLVPEGFPLHARVRYRAERVTFEGGTRRDTVERLSLSVGIGRP